MMKLETVNIVLAILVLIGLIYLAMNLKGDEHFRQMDDQKCKFYTGEYCNQMKSSEYGTTGDPSTLSNMMRYCGGDKYPDVSTCVPEWAYKEGGNFDRLFGKVLDTPVMNTMY